MTQIPTPLVPTRNAALNENRSIDGSGNNVENPTLGQAGTSYARIAPVSYIDGIGEMDHQGRATVRHVSNAIFNQRRSHPDPRGLSDIAWAFGQFVSHDINATTPNMQERLRLKVPAGDVHFDPQGTGEVVMIAYRSKTVEGTGQSGIAREQINKITSWLDASGVYGSNESRAQALRTGEGGKLKLRPNGMLPLNIDALPNDNPMNRDPQTLLLAGDTRANQHIGLIAFHTLFAREHNRVADMIAAENPMLDDEGIYQLARKIVSAKLQYIVYNEYLPSLLGENALSEYTGYNPELDPALSNAFSAAAFRILHSQTSNHVKVANRPDLRLRLSYYLPEVLTQEGGLDPVMQGLASKVQEANDRHVVDDLRNYMFGRPGAGGLDLISLDLIRGRDHGLPPYNQLREALGLSRHNTFEALTDDPQMLQSLPELYDSIDQIDPIVGMLLEETLPQSSVGETAQKILVEQFERLRDSDRFWYQNDPALEPYRAMIESTTLSSLIGQHCPEFGEQFPPEHNCFFVK